MRQNISWPSLGHPIVSFRCMLFFRSDLQSSMSLARRWIFGRSLSTFTSSLGRGSYDMLPAFQKSNTRCWLCNLLSIWIQFSRSSLHLTRSSMVFWYSDMCKNLQVSSRKVSGHSYKFHHRRLLSISMNISDIRSSPILSLALHPTFAKIHGCSPLLHLKTRLLSQHLRFHKGWLKTVRLARVFWAATSIFIFVRALNAWIMDQD